MGTSILAILGSVVAALLPLLAAWVEKKVNETADLPAQQRREAREDAQRDIATDHLEAVRGGDTVGILTAWERHDRMLRETVGVPRSSCTSSGQDRDAPEPRQPRGVYRDRGVAAASSGVRASSVVRAGLVPPV